MSRRGFTFRLARVLEIRRLEERVARTAWSEAEAAAAEAEARCDALRRELEEARAALRATLAPRPGGALDARNVDLAHAQLDRRAAELTRAQETLLTLRDQARRLSEAWREHDARRRGLERLEERALERHRREVSAKEAQEADERAARGADGQA